MARVLLISANTETINMPTMPLGLALVSAATRRAGHAVRFLDLMRVDDGDAAVRQCIAGHRPQVIGISVRNIDDQEARAPRFLLDQVRPLVELCRQCCGASIILGGAGYSIFPRQALAHLGADYGVWGDGEVAFPALLERLERGAEPIGLPGVQLPDAGSTCERELPHDLDSLPLADEELWSGVDPGLPNLWVPVQSRRGCPNDCAYCSTARIQGRAIRSRDAGAVVEQFSRMVPAGFRRFYLVDNSFNIPEAHGLALCEAIAASGLDVQWRCILYPHRVSEELVRAMRCAGCVEVALGFESGCDRMLERLKKRFTTDDVREVAERLQRHGIRRMGFLLLGGPGETRQSVEQSLAFAAGLELEALRITVGLRIYPETPLARLAADEGVVAAGQPLLRPCFYVAEGLAPWVHRRVARY